MLSKTLLHGLNDYGIGAKTRARRAKPPIGSRRSITLVAQEKLRPHDHAGVEFTYVIHGLLSVHMSGEEHGLAG